MPLVLRADVRNVELINGVDGYAIEITLMHYGQLQRHTIYRQSQINTPWKLHLAAQQIRRSYGLEEKP